MVHSGGWCEQERRDRALSNVSFFFIGQQNMNGFNWPQNKTKSTQTRCFSIPLSLPSDATLRVRIAFLRACQWCRPFSRRKTRLQICLLSTSVCSGRSPLDVPLTSKMKYLSSLQQWEQRNRGGRCYNTASRSVCVRLN
jgi:hypothetical protein